MSDAFSNATTLNDVQLNALITENIATAARDAVIAAGRFTVKNLDPNEGPNSWTFTAFGALSATAITEETGQESAAVSTDGVTIAADLVGVTVKLTKQARVRGVRGLTMQIQREMGAAAAAKMDTDVLALASGFSNSAGTTVTDLSLLTLVTAKQVLGAAKPLYGYFGDATSLSAGAGALSGPMLFIDHIGKGDLDRDLIVSGAAWLSDPAAAKVLLDDGTAPNGFVGSLLGVPVFVSDNVKVSSSDRHGMLATPSAIGVVVKELVTFDADKDVQKRLSIMTVDSNYGAGEWLDRCGVKLIYGNS